MEAADYDLVVDVENPRHKTARKVLRDSGNGLTGWNTQETLKTAPNVTPYVRDAGHYNVGVKLTPILHPNSSRRHSGSYLTFPDEVDFDFVAFVQHDYKGNVAQRHDNQEILDGSKRLGFWRLWGETETKKVEAEKKYVASEAGKYLR